MKMLNKHQVAELIAWIDQASREQLLPLQDRVFTGKGLYQDDRQTLLKRISERVERLTPAPATPEPIPAPTFTETKTWGNRVTKKILVSQAIRQAVNKRNDQQNRA